MKELKLKIESFDRVIVIQTLKINGTFWSSEHVKFSFSPAITKYELILNKHNDITLGIAYFKDNEERDFIFDRVIKWITDEQFPRPRTELAIGEEALFSDISSSDGIKRKLIYILPEKFESRYISDSDSYPHWCYWKYAYPVQDVLKVKGNVYHWRTPND